MLYIFRLAKCILYYCRIHARYYAKDIGDLVILMYNHLMKAEPQDNLFQPYDTWITTKKVTKPCVPEHLDTINLSRSHYIAASFM